MLNQTTPSPSYLRAIWITVCYSDPSKATVQALTTDLLTDTITIQKWDGHNNRGRNPICILK